MSAWHNEKDAHAAEWLRNLIGLGELPDGEVDERSIVDVRGDDLAGYDEVHFFAGIGVWARAVAEAEQASGRRLARPLFTGSCPCQPLSVAGQRQGHVDQRHLWPAFHALIAERRPATILGEQVAGKDGREWMAAVRHDLEASGYAVGTAILPAGGFGAPHIRYRLFFVADAGRERGQHIRHDMGAAAGGNEGQAQQRQRLRPDDRPGGATGLVAQSAGQGPQGRGSGGGSRPGRQGSAAERSGAPGLVADADGVGSRQRSTGLPSDGDAPYGNNVDRRGALGGLADAAGARHEQAREYQRGPSSLPARPAEHGRNGGLADAGRARLQSAGDAFRSSGAVGECGEAGWPGPPDSFWSDADWIFCRDNKWRPVEPGSQPLVDGSAFLLGSGGPYEGMSRAGMLRGYGNAVVLPVARAFVEAAIEAIFHPGNLRVEEPGG